MEKVDAERISIIPPGLDTNKFKSAGKFDNSRITVLFVGRLVEGKGILDLINAMGGFDAKLSIVGDGPLRSDVISLSKKNNLDMKFVDSLDYFEMAKVYNSCDIFCLPSKPTKIWEEQFGYAFIEAMACEKPVISTLSGSIPEVVDEKSGILVNPGNVPELKDALGKLINDGRLRKKIGKNGRKRVLEKYDGKVIARQIKDVYESYL